MRILMLSKEGDGAALAVKLTREGHHVDLWIKDPSYEYALKGIVGRPASWRPVVGKADLVLADMVGFSRHADLFRSLGKPSLNINEIGDTLELDRSRAMQLCQKLGIETPPSVSFGSPAEARKLEWKNPLGYVVKPLGNLSPGKTMVCEDREVYEWALSTYGAQDELLVQEVVEGVEVSTEGWFNGVGWIHPFNHTFEEKNFLGPGVGKMTGCMGNVVLTIEKADRLVRETLMKLEPFLKKAGYRGPIDVNCIVNEKHAYVLEFTCRFGSDALEALMTGLKEPTAALMFETAMGIKKEMDISRDFLMAVRVSREPYPFGPAKGKDRGMPICGLTDTDMKFVFPSDIYEDNGWKYAASDGVLLRATSFGRSVKEAQHRVYKICKNIQGDVQYRLDIGDRVEKDLAKLRSWAWL